MRRQLIGAAGFYVQGENVISEIGPALKRAGYAHLLIVHGREAIRRTGFNVYNGLKEAGLTWSSAEYTGFCTYNDIEAAALDAQPKHYDCVLGIGGGKVMDFSKAVADRLSLPVYLVPTVAATCAACAPLSVIYTHKGRQESIRFYDRPIQGVWADLTVLCAAPVRYLAAGIADSFAKSCEYSSMRRQVRCGDMETGLFMGYSMACAVDETLLKCARTALEENKANNPGPAFADAVASVILFTGIISSTGGFGGRQNARFRIAHGFNEIIRGQYVSDVRRWLHGEIVAVGILAQLRANRDQRYGEILNLFRDIHVPVTLSELGMDTSPQALEQFTDHLIRHCHTEEDCIPAVRQAVMQGA